MKILILSDTHGEISAAERIIRRENPNHVIHLGDCLRDAEELSHLFPVLPICKIPGNNDWFSDEAKEKVIFLGETKIFLCHGHTTGVKSGLDVQWAKAKKADCNVSLFGHTHRPFLEERDGVLLLNPGSVTYGGTYALLTLSPKEPPKAEIKYDD
ncbi:MAG: metallophosphoesterase [Clostridia bacterium]|nr:metallophosphoesterase [Clostridia bacterium]